MHSYKNYYMRKHCKINILILTPPPYLEIGKHFCSCWCHFAPSPHNFLTLLDTHLYSLILYKDLALVLGCTQTSITHCDPKSCLTFGNSSHTSYIKTIGQEELNKLITTSKPSTCNYITERVVTCIRRTTSQYY